MSTDTATASVLTTRVLKPGLATQIDVEIHRLIEHPALIGEVRRIWQTSPVIIFRRQLMHEHEQVRFSSMFGECMEIHRKDNVSPHQPKIVYFSTLRYNDGRPVGAFNNGDEAAWHSDQTYTARPATGAMLYGVEVPRDCGDMSWADQYGAYALLPEDVKRSIAGKVGVFRYAKDPDYPEVKTNPKLAYSLPDALHEVVITHPVTGRKSLYVDPTRLVELQGLSKEENERVLPILFKAACDDSLVYCHTVESGDVMLWDNAATLHRREPLSMTQPRLMKRTTFYLPKAAHGLPSGCFSAVNARAAASAG
jgi:taurine dioxygenase